MRERCPLSYWGFGAKILSKKVINSLTLFRVRYKRIVKLHVQTETLSFSGCDSWKDKVNPKIANSNPAHMHIHTCTLTSTQWNVLLSSKFLYKCLFLNLNFIFILSLWVIPYQTIQKKLKMSPVFLRFSSNFPQLLVW